MKTFLNLLLAILFTTHAQINQQCIGDDCVQIGQVVGVLNIEGCKVQLGINNGTININYIGDPKDKENIKNYSEKVANLEKQIDKYIISISQKEKRNLSDNEKLAKATGYVSILLKQIEQLNTIISKLDDKNILTMKIKEAREKLDVNELKELLNQKQQIEDSTSAETAFQLAGLYNVDLEYDNAYKNYMKAITCRPLNSLYLNDAGAMLMSIAQYNNAVSLFDKSLQLDLNSSENKQCDIFRDYNNLGSVYQKIGNYKKANEYYYLALSIQNISRLEHAHVFNNLGTNWQELGDYNKADSFFDLSIAKLNPKHPSLARYYNNLGSLRLETWKLIEALQCFQNALSKDTITYKYNHPYIVTDYNNIGLTYKMMGENQKAINFLHKAITCSSQLYGKYNDLVATSYNNIALVFLNLNELDSSCYYQTLAFTIDTTIFPKDHPNVTRDLTNLSCILVTGGMFKEAVKYGELALTIDLNKFGPDHPIIATDQNNLGVAWQHLKNYTKALNYYKAALAIGLSKFGEEHQDVIQRRCNIASDYKALGHYKEAVNNYEIAIESSIKVYGRDDAYTKNIILKLQAIKNK